MLQGAAGQNCTIITASRRLARALISEHGRQQLTLGRRAWLSPDIRFLDDWLATVAATATRRMPIVLGKHASTIVWERSLGRQAGDRLPHPAALVRQARQSWQRLHDWQVPVAEVSAAARTQDERLFAAAAGDYAETLEQRGWIDAARLAGLVNERVCSGDVGVPARITYAGFDRLVPAVRRLFETLADNGCEVSAAQSHEASASIEVAMFDNSEAELRAAGAWARRELLNNPAASIGIVSPSLDRNAMTTERLVREGVAPGWQYGGTALQAAVNTSYGRRFSEYPAVAVALLVLQWAHRELSFDDISILLRSQFIAGQETDGRCRLEMYLRRLPDRPRTPRSIIRLFKSLAKDADTLAWLEAVEHIASFRAAATGKAGPAGWARRIDALLATLGWPATRTLESDEFQMLNRWRELLNELARLEIVTPEMSFAEASQRLALLAGETIYQAESHAPAVQLLGPLEAAGMRFDSLWVCGLDADTWPPAAHPLTLVSRQLQRMYGMPDATPDDTLEYSRRVLDRLVASADRVRLSWPHSSEDSENPASRLILQYGRATAEGTEEPGWHAIGLIGSVALDDAPADPVPAIMKGERVAGGALTVQRQVTEPFAAFAFGRLRVAELDTVVAGLSPARRGSLIHNALHELFRDRPSQEEIRRWHGANLDARITDAVDSSLRKLGGHADAVLRRVLALERERLHAVLRQLIEAELRRTAFGIEAVECEMQFENHGVHLKLRIDRIDRLADGSLLIADYKTGQQKRLLNRNGEPHDLQLVVYASAVEEPVGGLVLINVDSRSVRYSGASADGEWDARRAAQWQLRLAAWQAQVERAMQQISMGDARINLGLPAAKTRALNILSRFQERLRAAS